MTIYRGPGGTGSATSDADTNLYQQFLTQTQAARDAALQAETNAELAETNAKTAEANAAASASAAASSASSAATSATNAANSASNASSSASAAAASASEAAGYAASINPADLVHISGTETITGAKTFSQTISGSVTGNAGTVTNGVYTDGSYADPAWITSVSGSKVSGNISGSAANVTGTVAVANGGTGATTASAARTNLGLGTLATLNSISQSNLNSNVAGTGPVFSAYQNSAQSLSAGTNTKILFQAEDFDTANCFTSSRFTPNVAGYYLCTCGVRTDNSVGALHTKLTASTVGEFAAGTFTNTSLSAFMSSTTGLVYLNGSTDYVEVYVFSGSNITLSPGRGATYFSGVLVRAQ